MSTNTPIDSAQAASVYEAIAPLQVRQVTPTLEGEGESAAPNVSTRNWIRAVQQGFHEAEPTPGELRFATRQLIRKQSVGTVVYDESLGDDPNFGAAFPVATFESFPGSLNLGGAGGADVPLDMITGVTVNPTHRRRGILKTIMTAHLRKAAERCPVASLTVTEGSIYGRFGFAPVTFTHALEVDVKRALLGSKLDGGILGERSGSIRHIAIQELPGVLRDVATAHHRSTFGSVLQHAYFESELTGEDHEGLKGDMGKRRALIHVTDDGVIDGCASYEHHGWETKPFTLELHGLVAANALAERELWRHFMSMDLVDKITCRNRSLYTLDFFEDPRVAKSVAGEDLIWWRILDLPAVVEKLPYRASGEAVFTVKDKLGLASGTFTLRVPEGGGAVVVEKTGEIAKGTEKGCVLSVTDFTRAISGHVGVRKLADMGLCTGSDEEIAALDRLFSFSIPAQSFVNF